MKYLIEIQDNRTERIVRTGLYDTRDAAAKALANFRKSYPSGEYSINCACQVITQYWRLDSEIVSMSPDAVFKHLWDDATAVKQ